ncbi:hypothetical protein DEO72_LG8g1324 [Vigna unguiculata]|uniref:Uncharacterized protein n=1 Tax=Vigna unguiculata TaxID=3917 RepID=A0A4D6MP46_VIGUN|nr:hypothetical protein DEO72_LG8g1324 [Vigna unguiculata]
MMEEAWKSGRRVYRLLLAMDRGKGGGFRGSSSSGRGIESEYNVCLLYTSKLESHGQDQAFFSKLASKAKMLSPSHPRAEIPHVATSKALTLSPIHCKQEPINSPSTLPCFLHHFRFTWSFMSPPSSIVVVSRAIQTVE